MSQGKFCVYADKSQLSMVFTMRSIENTVTPILGSTVLRSLTTFPLELSLMAKFSVCTEDSALRSRLLIKLELLTEELRCLMRVLSVT